jgi:hypothetical protein
MFKHVETRKKPVWLAGLSESVKRRTKIITKKIDKVTVSPGIEPGFIVFPSQK